MSKYRDEEISGFLLRSGYPLKQIVRVANMLRKTKEEDVNEKLLIHKEVVGQ